jgi:hypothetical protein
MARTKAEETTEQEKKEAVPLLEALKRYHVKLTFISAILGSAPSNKGVYENYIASKKPDATMESVAAEVAMIPEELPPTGKTIFRVDPDTKGLIFLAHQIRGFLKESASAITGKGLTAYKSKIDKWVFVNPDKIFIKRNGEIVTAADGTCERPLRAVTAQGPRVSLLSSEQINEGVTVEFDLLVMPLGQKEISEELLDSWLQYGQFQGISQWRNGSYGRFTYELSEAKAQ